MFNAAETRTNDQLSPSRVVKVNFPGKFRRVLGRVRNRHDVLNGHVEVVALAPEGQMAEADGRVLGPKVDETDDAAKVLAEREQSDDAESAQAREHVDVDVGVENRFVSVEDGSCAAYRERLQEL